MSDGFDPYYQWLGISPKDQPPHHYRLLAIDLWESNPSVIEHAADQRMAYLRTFQTGPHAALSQKLLNEVAAAKVCLLNPTKKAAYDAQLRQQLVEAAAVQALPTPSPTAPTPPPTMPTLPPSAAPSIIPQAGPTPSSPAQPIPSTSVVPDLPADSVSASWAGPRLGRQKIPDWVWALAAVLPVVIAATAAVLVVVPQNHTPPVRETAQAKSAKPSTSDPRQPFPKEATRPPESPKLSPQPIPREKNDDRRLYESPVEVVQPAPQFAPEEFPEQPTPSPHSKKNPEAIRQWIDGWSEPVNLGPMINSPFDDYFAELSADGLILLFASTRPGGQGGTDIWMSQRASVEDPFSPPVNLGPPINSIANENGPALSADGLILLFNSDRPGGQGGSDIWMSRRASLREPFGPPVNLGPPINSSAADIAPNLSSDGLILFFESTRAGGQGGYDIWMSRRASPQEPFGPPVNLGPPINTNGDEGLPKISTDGLILLFHGYLRQGGAGGLDIFLSRRASPKEPFGPPIKLGPAINTKDGEGGPKLSADGLTLLFHSDRPGGEGGWDLWMSRRRTAPKQELTPTLPTSPKEKPPEKPRPADPSKENFEAIRQWLDGWSEPVNMGAMINSHHNEYFPELSADGLLLLFASDRPGGQGGLDIWMSRRTSPQEPFGPPINLGSTINTRKSEGGPTLSADALMLLFHSDRPGGQGGLDIWMSRRTSVKHPFGPPVNLGPLINTNDHEAVPRLSGDGLTLLFHSNRPGGQGLLDIGMSRRVSLQDPWGPPINLGPSINTTALEAAPSLSADGLILLFESNRPRGQGSYDIWMSWRDSPEEPFGLPLNLGPVINTTAGEGGPTLSADGLTLLFHSNRPGGQGGWDLWMCRRRTAPKLELKPKRNY